MALELLMKGLLLKQIAGEMGISERTVKEFLCQARERFGAHTNPQLVALYLTRKGGDVDRGL